MKPGQFYFIAFLCVVFAGLTLVQTLMYQKWEQELAEQRQLQTRDPYVKQVDGFTEQLLRRTVTDSLHDPALSDLLKRLSITVVISPPHPATPEYSPPAPGPTPTPAHP